MPKILIIDDDEIQRLMLSAVLESQGYMVQLADNGIEGMRILLADTPDLVLLDYEMPEIDGIELLTKMRKSHSAEDLPVIMLTGHNEVDVVNSCLMSGANDFLVKPVKVESLHNCLQHFFPQHKKQT